MNSNRNASPWAGLKAAIAAISALCAASCMSMERRALAYVEEAPALSIPDATISDDDLAGLPPPVQRYFRYSGVIGKRRVSSFSVVIEARIRNGSDSPWMDMVMRQYNRLDEPARIVYIESKKPPMAGIDSYLGGKGRMHIKTMGFITVVDVRGPEMDSSALVTFLNDLVLCPVGYFSVPVAWTAIDDGHAGLSLSWAGIDVKATLTFAPDGRLLDWRSDDRYAEVKGRILKDRWSTPFGDSIELSGMRIPGSGTGVHDYDGTPYGYVELERVLSLTLDAEGLPVRP